MVQPVVAGVDGSNSSHEALRVAVEEARMRGARVRAVHAWHVPESLYGDGYAPTPGDVHGYEDDARRLLEEAVAPFGGDARVTVEPVLVEARSAAQALVEESEHAALLVVGSRGLHGFREVVLGSVSHACCQHAACPVLVVRGRP